MMTNEALPHALIKPETGDSASTGLTTSTAVTVGQLRRAAEALRDLRIEDAIDDYRLVLQAEPDNFYALAGIGIALTRVGITDQALRALHRASIMRPPSWEAFQVLSTWTRFAERQAAGNFRRSTATESADRMTMTVENEFLDTGDGRVTGTMTETYVRK